MVMEYIFRSIFWIGIISLIISLFIDFSTSTHLFVITFGGGVLFIIDSLYEQYLLKRAKLASATPVTPSSTPAPIAKKITPIKPLSLSLPSTAPSRSLFSRLFGFFHRQPKKTKLPSSSVPLASLNNVKQLFTEELHLQQQPRQPGTFQRPTTSQPLTFLKSFQRPVSPPLSSQRSSLPPQPQEELLPFEEGLEHYVPTGAEQLPHDHHNRYEEAREIISLPSDMRYQQVSQQQRTPSLQQPSPHHLSLPRYLHYKDKQHERRLFIILLCLSIVLIAVSLLLPFQKYVAFVVTLLLLGLLLFSASFAELIHSKHHAPLLTASLPQQTAPQTATLKPQASSPIASQQKTQTPIQQTQQPAKPTASQNNTEHLATLLVYVQDSLKQNYPYDAIRKAAQQSGWPDTLIDQAFATTQVHTSKKKKAIVLISLVSVLLLLLFMLNSSDMFLLPYWLDILSDASPQFYFIMIGVFLLTILLFVHKVHKVYKAKQIQYRVQEQEHVAAIKQELQIDSTTIVRGTYETDFDRLYKLLSEKQKLTITEVAQGFNISRKEAEEWGKILKEQGLIEIHYPTVGDLELLWKK